MGYATLTPANGGAEIRKSHHGNKAVIFKGLNTLEMTSKSHNSNAQQSMEKL